MCSIVSEAPSAMTSFLHSSSRSRCGTAPSVAIACTSQPTQCQLDFCPASHEAMAWMSHTSYHLQTLALRYLHTRQCLSPYKGPPVLHAYCAAVSLGHPSWHVYPQILYSMP